METDASCGTCNRLFQPLDLEKSFFQGFLSGGRTVGLFMAAISTVKSCLVITACHNFPPQLPPPILLHFYVSCSFAKLKVCLFEVFGEDVFCHDKNMEHQQTLGVSDEWGSTPLSAYAFHPISNGADFTCTLKEKRSTSTYLRSLIAKGSDLVASLNTLYHSSLLLQILCHRGVIQIAWTNFILDVTRIRTL